MRPPPRSRIQAAIPALLVVFTCFQSGFAALVHRWSFNEPAGSVPAGSVLQDSVSALPMTVRGLGAARDGQRLTLPGTTHSGQPDSAISAYLNLPNGIISSKTNLTVELWAAPIAVRNWASLFEFGRMTIAGDGVGAPGEWTGATASGPVNSEASDLLALTSSRGFDLNLQRQVMMINYGWQGDIQTSLPTTPGQLYHYVVTVAATPGGSSVAWYRDGILAGVSNVAFGLSAIEDVNNWFGRSHWSTLSTGNTAYDEIRLFDHAFTPSEVAASLAAGPDAAFGPPQTAPDAATLHHLQKVLIPVLDNDSGELSPGSLAIVQPPAFGSLSIRPDGRILYAHTTGTPATDAFTYRVSGPGGLSAPELVSLTFAQALRIGTAAHAMPPAPPATAISHEPAFGALAFNQPIALAGAPGDSQRLFVVQRRGLVRVIPDVSAPSPAAPTFLNLAGLLTARGELLGDTYDQGLMSMAVHPGYATNGYFFLWYSVRVAGTDYFRISRFARSAGNPDTADPSSELVLLQQLDPNGYHLGTDMHFGPDGYLYIALGDGGGQNDSRQVSQRINQDFFSAMLRIDVDKRPGNPEPNLHASVPRDGPLARYSVPADNPFVTANATVSFNGQNFAANSVRTEFYAVGLRNPWRFSFDPVSGELWCGDVGQVTYEEVNRIVSGGNYGWSFREGTEAGPQMWRAPPGFVGLDPIYQYGSDTPGNYNRSITGGVPYHGARIPSLAGAYVFADYMTGDISSLRLGPGGAAQVERLAGEGGIVSFGIDPSNGDVLMVDLADGLIRRLVQGANDAGFPQTLADTGLFSEAASLAPAPGLLPYLPNLSFWSDHAIKRRWFMVPGATHDLTWAREGAWTYPSGMVWVKHFDLETTRGDPATAQRVETRVLVKTDAGSYGVSYRWDAGQTSATLVADAGQSFDIPVLENGNPRMQRYRIPSRAECLSCHTPQAGSALSFNTRQLNRDFSIHGFSGNQIDLLHAAGYFSNTPEPAALLPRHVRPDETAFPVEARARSYLEVNCANCHRAGGTAPATWDGREELTLAGTGLIDGAAVNNGGNPANRLVVSGDLAHSIVYNRVAATNGFTRMPPLGTTELDAGAIALLAEWIGSSLPQRQTYAAWRQAQFGAADSPQGAPEFDAEPDGATNYQEYLAGTLPLDSGSLPVATLHAAGPSEVSVGSSLPANRAWQVETCTDLLSWTPWHVPGNAGMAHPGGPFLLTGPAGEPRRYFRLRIWER